MSNLGDHFALLDSLVRENGVSEQLCELLGILHIQKQDSNVLKHLYHINISTHILPKVSKLKDKVTVFSVAPVLLIGELPLFQNICIIQSLRRKESHSECSYVEYSFQWKLTVSDCIKMVVIATRCLQYLQSK